MFLDLVGWKIYEKSLIEDPVDVATKKFTDLWERPKKGHEHYDRRINHAIDIFSESYRTTPPKSTWWYYGTKLP